jgi:hypothetical protein
MAEDFEYMQQFARVTAAAVAVEAGDYDPESLDEVAARAMNWDSASGFSTHGSTGWPA